MSYQTRECEHCGTMWQFDTKGNRMSGGGMSGFIEVTIYYHRKDCGRRTPEERLEWINRNEKRLKKKPNLHTEVFFDRNHQGVAKKLTNTHSRSRTTRTRREKNEPPKPGMVTMSSSSPSVE